MSHFSRRPRGCPGRRRTRRPSSGREGLRRQAKGTRILELRAPGCGRRSHRDASRSRKARTSERAEMTLVRHRPRRVSPARGGSLLPLARGPPATSRAPSSRRDPRRAHRLRPARRSRSQCVPGTHLTTSTPAARLASWAVGIRASFLPRRHDESTSAPVAGNTRPQVGLHVLAGSSTPKRLIGPGPSGGNIDDLSIAASTI